jgi:hypothetical protein|tara:strand:+ start:48 stop:293 length:246 start_codon:yes stop_codon:yes gene_type:complete
MSSLKVDEIANRAGTGAPVLDTGGTVAVGYALTCGGGTNVTGVITATSFIGDGSGITNMPVVTPGKTIALKYILKFDEFRT